MARFLAGLLLVLIVASFALTQNSPACDPQALAYAAKSIAAMTAATPTVTAAASEGCAEQRAVSRPQHFAYRILASRTALAPSQFITSLPMLILPMLMVC